MHTETITWHTASNPPDDESTVLVQVHGEPHAWLGYRDAGQWVSTDGMPIAATVLAWAEPPVGPVA